MVESIERELEEADLALISVGNTIKEFCVLINRIQGQCMELDPRGLIRAVQGRRENKYNAMPTKQMTDDLCRVQNRLVAALKTWVRTRHKVAMDKSRFRDEAHQAFVDSGWDETWVNARGQLTYEQPE